MEAVGEGEGGRWGGREKRAAAGSNREERKGEGAGKARRRERRLGFGAL